MAAPDTDKELPGLLKKAKKKKQHFGLVTKGNDGKLILSKRPVKPGVLKNVKKELGAKKILTGECVGKDGALVFYSEIKAPSGVDKLVKKLAKAAGVSVKVKFEQGSAP